MCAFCFCSFNSFTALFLMMVLKAMAVTILIEFDDVTKFIHLSLHERFHDFSHLYSNWTTIECCYSFIVSCHCVIVRTFYKMTVDSLGSLHSHQTQRIGQLLYYAQKWCDTRELMSIKRKHSETTSNHWRHEQKTNWWWLDHDI